MLPTLWAMRCAFCAEENLPRARFCQACGREIRPVSDTEAVTRRVVTVLFADMVGSTGIAERLDPEVVQMVQGRYFDALRRTIEGHGGVVEKFIGDAVMAVFGWPRAHEDDPTRAMKAATAFAGALASLNDDLARRGIAGVELRVGIATGPVVARSTPADALVTGDVVNVAARLEQSAAPGQIIVSSDTWRRATLVADVEPLGLVDVRGRDAPVEALRLRAVSSSLHRRSEDRSLVGRDDELARLEGLFERVISGATTGLAMVVGPAGSGKSRLTRELIARVGGSALVLRGRCLAYGDAITYWPVTEILRDAVGSLPDTPGSLIVERLEQRLAVDLGSRLDTVIRALLGMNVDPVDENTIAFGIRQLFELLAAARPLLVLIEDVHWADAQLMILLGAIRSLVQNAPILLVATARPGSVTNAATEGLLHDEWIELEPLGDAAVDALLDEIPGGEALGPKIRSRIAVSAEGNPLYVEELVGMLVDQGRLRLSDERWLAQTGLESLPLPPTIAALLAARLDGLDRSEQLTAERGSIVGRSFEQGAVYALSDEGERARIADGLLGLLREDIIRPGGRGLDGEAAFRFRHILIRDAAYDRLSKTDRARLHEAFVTWLDGVVGAEAESYVEIAAHHLAEAAEYRWELSPREESTRRLSDGAVDRLIAAANRAQRLHALSEASRHLGRAARLVDRAEDPARGSALRRRQADFAYLAGDITGAIEAEREAIRLLPRQGGAEEAAALRELAIYVESYGSPVEAMGLLDRGLVLAERANDATTYRRLLIQRARFLMVGNEIHAARAPAERAVELARRSGDGSDLSHALSTLGIVSMRLGDHHAALEYLTEARDIADRIDDVDAGFRARSNRLVVINSGRIRVDVLDEFDALAERAAQQGRTTAVIGALMNAAISAWAAGRPDVAEERARRLVDEHIPSENTAFGWRMLSAVIAAQGRFDEAQEAAEQARALLGRLGVSGREADYESVEAEILAWLGEPETALEIVDEAVGREGERDPDLVARLLILGVRCAVDAALDVGPDGRESFARRAGRMADQLEALAESVPAAAFSWEGHTALLLLRPELSRLGPDRPDLWQSAAEQLRDMNVPPLEAYALWRRAEALSKVGAPDADIESARHEAVAMAQQVKAQHLVDRLLSLSESAAPR